jgi:hypothetical protein
VQILDYYADNGEAFLADKNLNPESGEAIIRNSPIGVLFGVCGTFLLSDSTVCCAKYNGRKHHIIETCLWYHSVSQWKNCLKKRKLRRIIHQSIDFGKKKYRFSK